MTLSSRRPPGEFSTLQSRKLRNAFSGLKTWEGHTIIEFHPWLEEHWAERWLTEQNRSWSVEAETLSESPQHYCLRLPRLPWIIFPSRINQTPSSLISGARKARLQGHGARCLSSSASLLTSRQTIFWNVDSASFGNACLTLFREPKFLRTFVKYMVTEHIMAWLIQALARAGAIWSKPSTEDSKGLRKHLNPGAGVILGPSYQYSRCVVVVWLLRVLSFLTTIPFLFLIIVKLKRYKGFYCWKYLICSESLEGPLVERQHENPLQRGMATRLLMCCGHSGLYHPPQQLSCSAQAALTRDRGPGGLNDRNVFSSWLEGHDQGSSRPGA